MPTFDYNLNIPAGPNNPSNDQPLMQTNTNSIDGLIGVDHYTFETNNLDGFHKQCTFPIESTPTTDGNQLAIFSNSGASGTELFMVRDNILGTLTNLTTSKISVPKDNTNGYSWLPGGILIQWGQESSTGSATPILFVTNNVDFPNNVFSINTTRSQTNTGTGYGVTNLSTTGFTFNANSSSVGINFWWIAIGN